MRRRTRSEGIGENGNPLLTTQGAGLRRWGEHQWAKIVSPSKTGAPRCRTLCANFARVFFEFRVKPTAVDLFGRGRRSAPLHVKDGSKGGLGVRALDAIFLVSIFLCRSYSKKRRIHGRMKREASPMERGVFRVFRCIHWVSRV